MATTCHWAAPIVTQFWSTWWRGGVLPRLELSELNGIAAWIIVSTALLIGIIALLPRLMLSSSKALRIGDRVRLSGGHQDPAPWLQGRPEVYGRVTAFISRGNSRADEVAFESPFSYEGNTYPFAELRLLFKGGAGHNTEWCTSSYGQMPRRVCYPTPKPWVITNMSSHMRLIELWVIRKHWFMSVQHL